MMSNRNNQLMDSCLYKGGQPFPAKKREKHKRERERARERKVEKEMGSECTKK